MNTVEEYKAENDRRYKKERYLLCKEIKSLTEKTEKFGLMRKDVYKNACNIIEEYEENAPRPS